MTDDLSAAIESGYNPSSANRAMCVADLCTPSMYLAYFICTLLGIKESYFKSLCNKLKQLFSIIGFSHIWVN
jgi:hypothetical protein